ncbi:MAG: hypothetical protein UMU75_01355 [Halomonas sp.]|nr:hypothetical protein [Halomonas sp.]
MTTADALHLKSAAKSSMKAQRYLAIVLLAILMLPSPLLAQGLYEEARLSFNGFGTLGVVYNDTEEADFVRDISQPEGVDGWSARADSLLGAQLGLRISEKWDATIQAVSHYHYGNEYTPELTWAFLRYSPDPAAQFRVGRLGWDVYMLSDARHVGYAYLWARPPVDHFGILQLGYIDGADIVLKYPLGKGLAWVKFYAGHSRETLLFDNDFRAELETSQLAGGHINYEAGPWRFRMGYTSFKTDSHFSGDYVDSLARVLPLDIDALLSEGFGFERFQFFSLGAAYEKGPLQVQAMWNTTSLADESGDIESGFVSAGYRLGNVTPFVMVSQTESRALKETFDFGYRQATYSAGLRYDFVANLALKAQMDSIDVEEPGLLWRNRVTGWNGGRVTLFSLGLDFVF